MASWVSAADSAAQPAEEGGSSLGAHQRGAKSGYDSGRWLSKKAKEGPSSPRLAVQTGQSHGL